MSSNVKGRTKAGLSVLVSSQPKFGSPSNALSRSFDNFETEKNLQDVSIDFQKIETIVVNSMKSRFILSEINTELDVYARERRKEIRKKIELLRKQHDSSSHEVIFRQTATMMEIILFLISSNVTLRWQLSRRLEQHREATLRSEKLTEQELQVLNALFDTKVFVSPMDVGKEIPFECSPDGPRKLLDDFNDDVMKYSTLPDETVSEIALCLKTNEQIFANAKAYKGTHGKDVGVGDFLIQFDYGFENYKKPHCDEEEESDDDDDDEGGELPIYAFESGDLEDCIVWSEESKYSTIKCATLESLIFQMTSEEDTDKHIRFVFLLTYHSFSTPMEVLQKLVDRFCIPKPPNVSAGELEYWQTNVEKPIRLKVFAILHSWIKELYSDFKHDEELKQALRNFLVTKMSDQPWCKKVSQTVLTALDKAEELAAKHVTRKKDAMQLKVQPKAFWGHDEIEELSSGFMDLDDLTIAEQITLADFEVFRKIKSRECLNQRWAKANKQELAPNLVATIDRFNRLNNFVQVFILQKVNEQVRTQALKKVLRIAENLQQLQNFNALSAVYSALNSNAVHRLKKTWEGLPQKQRAYWDELCSGLMSSKSNKTALRRAMNEARPPCIVYLGIYTADLTFIEDGNPDTVRGMIFWEKRCRLAERIQKIMQFQEQRYPINEIPKYQKLLEKLLVISHDDESLWEMSIEREPQATLSP